MSKIIIAVVGLVLAVASIPFVWGFLVLAPFGLVMTGSIGVAAMVLVGARRIKRRSARPVLYLVNVPVQSAEGERESDKSRRIA